MKEVKAYIKPHKLATVTQALKRIKEVTGLTVCEVKGFGRGRGRDARNGMINDFLPCVRIEVICRDEIVDVVVDTIEKAAYTGLKGDGKIYVIPVEQAVRISTGERGDDAV